ncbi:hypothetical protein [Halorussus lipolyticus]|uniref:hypothetical protein n=1 Tax=Halorussus lipolyticus TaxID=3034024 RepID=UPI0023E7E773|nr:hypothetical protein [Halorussus sp. DT80]
MAKIRSDAVADAVAVAGAVFIGSMIEAVAVAVAVAVAGLTESTVEAVAVAVAVIEDAVVDTATLSAVSPVGGDSPLKTSTGCQRK